MRGRGGNILCINESDLYTYPKVSINEKTMEPQNVSPSDNQNLTPTEPLNPPTAEAPAPPQVFGPAQVEVPSTVPSAVVQPINPEPTSVSPAQSLPITDPQQNYAPPQPAGLAAFPPIPSHTSKKPLFVILGIVLAVAVLVGGGLFAASKLRSVSKEEYRLASASASDMESKLSNMTFEVSSIESEINDSETQFNNQLDKAKKSIADFKTAQADLAKQKALKANDIGKLYKAYNDKQKTYLTDIESYATSMGKLGPAFIKCDETVDKLSASSSTTQIATDLETCANNIKAIEGLDDVDVKAYATVAQQSFAEYSSLVRQLAGLSSRDFEKRSALRTKLYDLDDSSRKKIDDIQSTIEKRFNEKTPKDELRKLSDSLFNKSLSTKK